GAEETEKEPANPVAFSDPDFRAVLSLESAGDPKISPDGSTVVYTVRNADWDDNRFDSELWMARRGEEPFPLTRTEGESSSDASWSPDGAWVALVADRGKGPQIWLISPRGGEARPLTAVEDGVSAFEWSPDGTQMAVAITDRQDPDRKKLEETYGEYSIEDHEFRNTHLWLLDVKAALADVEGAKLPVEATGEGDEEDDGKESDKPSPCRRLTGGTDFTVDTFRWSPDGTKIAFDHRPDPRVESRSEADLSIVDVESAEVTALVVRPGPDSDPRWSPDGAWVLFSTGDGDPSYYLNSELAKVPAAGGDPVVLTEGFDEDAAAVAWLDDGIRFLALDRTTRRLFRLDPESGEVSLVVVEDAPRIIWSADFSKDGRTWAFQGEGIDTVDEVYRVDPGADRARVITRSTEQTAGWAVGSREVVEWTSQDGARIEGILLKPDGFDPSVKHPLLVIIHGGPSWLSFPVHAYTYVYPVQQWLEKGAVILMPNYRGSAGYGEAFRSLNVRNLGVGDAWDVLSGVDHLVAQGFIDSDRVGAMGWSQGGYISAFLTTTSDRFAAISVGAGISNWMTYYVNTDIHPFTRHYLKGTPWSDPEIYAMTSPMTYINGASTPTLIQHGEFDRRVPTPNAYELYQGLQDVGVPVELVIYKGFGHGISKPKELLAAVWHNWQFFGKWIWSEDVVIAFEE
ncbi:MAG: S9 family peptidase, partial [Thermoanaerobaculales bacterium]|nr:S9 family peptidase [Thermoanaerobaculales bacterium]